MDLTTDAAAASSPADTAPISPSDRLAALSGPDLAKWRETGTLPDASPTTDDDDAVSSTAAPAVQAASTEVTEPASEPAKPKAKTEARFQALLAERAQERERADRLERELADLRRPAAPAAPAVSSPATARTLTETIQTPDVSKAPLNEAEFFSSFPEAAYGEYSRYAARYEYAALRQAERQDEQRQLQARTRDERIGAFVDRKNAAIQADPTFAAKLATSAVGNLYPTDLLPPGVQPTIWNHVAQDVIESPVAPQLLAHLADHPEELQALGALSEAAVHRAIGKLEARFDSAAVPVTTAPLTSNAPPPPPTLGSRPAQPADEVQAAIRDRDTGRYIAAMNKRDLAAARR